MTEQAHKAWVRRLGLAWVKQSACLKEKARLALELRRVGWKRWMGALRSGLPDLLTSKRFSGSGSAREAFELTPRSARRSRQPNCAGYCVLA